MTELAAVDLFNAAAQINRVLTTAISSDRDIGIDIQNGAKKGEPVDGFATFKATDDWDIHVRIRAKTSE